MGWPSFFPKDEQEKAEITQLLAEQKCIPVWLDKDVADRFILFNELYMKPTIHNFKSTGEVDTDSCQHELKNIRYNDLW